MGGKEQTRGAKKKLKKLTYIRLTDDQWERVFEIASREDIRVADVIRRAVKLFLAGGAEQLAKLERDQRRLSDEEIAGNWLLHRLTPRNCHLVWQIGEALERNEVPPDELAFLRDPRGSR